MKIRVLYLVVIVFFLISFKSYSQTISKEQFNRLTDSLLNISESLDENNLKFINTISPYILDSIKEKKLINIINNQMSSNTDEKRRFWVIPYIYSTKKDSVFDVSLLSFEILKRKKNEDFERAKYYYMIQFKAVFHVLEDYMKFKSFKILLEESEFQKWWLFQLKNYTKKALIFNKKYGYFSAPPPLPPKNLK